MNALKIPKHWEKWCKTGIHGKKGRKQNAVRKCLSNGQVRGYFSDLVLKPDHEYTHSMYPSFEHLVDSSNHKEAVVEARIFNDMKSHLSEAEFWLVIEHFFAVGLEKGEIKPPFGKRLPKNWSPKKHYVKKQIIVPAVLIDADGGVTEAKIRDVELTANASSGLSDEQFRAAVAASRKR